MASDADVYAALGHALGAVGVRWYVFGGQAAILHGATRFTEDVDVTVDVGSMPTASLVSALQAEGFAVRVVDDDFVEQTRVLPLVHQASGIPVDVVLAGPGIEAMFFERVVRVDIEGSSVPVACAEDIVVMKVLSGRPKDLEDVTSILAVQESFDAARARELLRLLEQALEQSDLLPSFETCMARASRAPGG